MKEQVKVLKVKCDQCGLVAQVTTVQADKGKVPVLTCSCNKGFTNTAIMTTSKAEESKNE